MNRLGDSARHKTERRRQLEGQGGLRRDARQHKVIILKKEIESKRKRGAGKRDRLFARLI